MRLNEIICNNNIFVTSKLLTESSVIFESENSTILLDVDETLLTINPPSDSLLEAFKNQSTDLDTTSDKSRIDISEFINAFEDYKYKEHIMFINHPKKGPIFVIFRPFLKEFLIRLINLPKNKAKNVVGATSNEEEIRKFYERIIQEYTGINIPMISPNETTLHTDSVVVDDNRGLGLSKYASTTIKNKAQYAKFVLGNVNKKTEIPNLINIKPFKGDLMDRGLNEALAELNRIL